jgi:hypothetical protein
MGPQTACQCRPYFPESPDPLSDTVPASPLYRAMVQSSMDKMTFMVHYWTFRPHDERELLLQVRVSEPRTAGGESMCWSSMINGLAFLFQVVNVCRGPVDGRLSSRSSPLVLPRSAGAGRTTRPLRGMAEGTEACRGAIMPRPGERTKQMLGREGL